MNPSELFIHRPIATILIIVFILVAGIVAFFHLSVASLPSVDLPTIRVLARLPGASPEVMASSVATPLERRLGQIAGVTELTSSNSYGSTAISIQFNMSRSIEQYANDVQAAINSAAKDLPSDMPSPPVYRKLNPSMIPVMILAVHSDSLSPGELHDNADSVIAQKISKIPGVAEVIINGSEKSAVRVAVDGQRLAGMGISLDEIRNSIRSHNFIAPMGMVSDAQRAMTLSIESQSFDAASLAPLIIKSGIIKSGIIKSDIDKDGNGQNGMVRLGDIATVSDSVNNKRLAGFFGTKKAVIMLIIKSPNANLIELIDEVKAQLPSIQKWLPRGVEVTVLSDRSGAIRSAIHHLEFSMLLSILMVILVIFLYLRRATLTLIPAITMPVAIAGTFAVMYFLDYSLDNLTLMALTVSTGFVVDDAIIMVENINRLYHQGLTPMQAARQGSRQIGFTIVSMSVSIIAVFIPVLFMPGVPGVFLRSFGVTISSAIVISAFVSISLSPMLAARLIGRVKPDDKGGAKKPRAKKTRAKKTSASAGVVPSFILGVKQTGKAGLVWVERFLLWLDRGYAKTLDLAFRYPRLGRWSSLAMAILTIYLYTVVPKGFVPLQDATVINGIAEAAPDISFAAMLARQQAISQILVAEPAVLNFSSFVGQEGSNSAQFYINLIDESKRDRSDQIIKRLYKEFAAVSGIRIYLTGVSDFRRGARGSKSQYQFSLLSNRQEDINDALPLVIQSLKQLPQIIDVTSDLEQGGKELMLTINRATAKRLGIDMTAVDNSLYNAFGQRQIATSFTQLNNYQIILEYLPSQMTSPQAVMNLQVPTVNGQMVPLAAFSEMVAGTSNQSIKHQGTAIANTISFNTAPGVPISEATDAIEAAVRNLSLPNSVVTQFAGEARSFKQDGNTMLLALLAAIIVTYLVLGILYESLLQPLTILSTIPSAGLGALLALLIFRVELSLFAMIGILLLVGIVKKNAIMMVDFALEEQRIGGQSPVDAIRKAAIVRFRPIMMTNLAAFFGALPLAIDTGPGSELRYTLGITLLGGLIVSQCLTLYSTPLVYLGLEGFPRSMARRGQKLGQFGHWIKYRLHSR